jgi:tRNA G18 (ribose-2'-O)-methylase SpoU
MERDIEVRDKFKLFAWGLNLKETMLRRTYFLEAVNELKVKLRKVLYMWQDKKAERNFKELANLIENYDKDDPYYKKKKLGKLSKKKQPVLFMTKEPLLQTVDEREEEEESFMINN